MKQHFLSIIAAFLLMPSIVSAGEPFKGTFVQKELGMKLVIDLYEESVDVPDMEMFGPLNGYINGNGLYRTWYVSKIMSCDEQKAVIHLSNDLGSETQTVELTLQGDSLLHFHQKGGVAMKRSDGKKLYKIQAEMVMKRQ